MSTPFETINLAGSPDDPLCRALSIRTVAAAEASVFPENSVH